MTKIFLCGFLLSLLYSCKKEEKIVVELKSMSIRIYDTAYLGYNEKKEFKKDSLEFSKSRPVLMVTLKSKDDFFKDKKKERIGGYYVYCPLAKKYKKNDSIMDVGITGITSFNSSKHFKGNYECEFIVDFIKEDSASNHDIHLMKSEALEWMKDKTCIECEVFATSMTKNWAYSEPFCISADSIRKCLE